MCLEHVCLIWIRSANSHTGQRRELRKQAGQMAASDHVQILEIAACFPRGVHRKQMHRAQMEPNLNGRYVFEVAEIPDSAKPIFVQKGLK